MKFTRIAQTAAAFLLTSAALLAQGSTAFQGEGTFSDFVMRTSVNGGPLDTLDKPMYPGDLLQIDFASTSGATNGTMIFLGADVAPVTFNWEVYGVIGLGANKLLLADGSDGSITVPAQLAFVIPPSNFWNTGFYNPLYSPTSSDFGLWLQSAIFRPGGSFFGNFEVSETIKHEVFESNTPGTFYDNCSSALNGPGLNDVNDLNVPIAFSTIGRTNNFETTGTSGFAQQTAFTVVAPGSGLGSSPSPAADVSVLFTVTTPGLFSFEVCGAWDSCIYLMPATCSLPTAGIVINDDAGSAPAGCSTTTLHSKISNVCLAAGSYILVLDGFGTTTGAANLIITKTIPSSTVAITSLTPNIGSGTTPPVVTIAGANFQPGATVTFDGITASGITVGATNCLGVASSIACTPPTHADGAVTVQVTNPDSTFATSTFTYSSNIITSIARSDDGAVAYPFTSGNFTFYGVTYTTVQICMNGRLMFGTTGTGDFSETTAEMRTQSPNIDMLWDDWNPSATGATVTASENSTTFSVAYANCTRYTSSDGLSNATVTLNKSTGEITYTYGACNNMGGIVGVSPGNSLFSATIPAEINMNVLTTFTATLALDPVYEQFANTTNAGADPFDLQGATIGFTPTGGVGVGPYMFHRP